MSESVWVLACEAGRFFEANVGDIVLEPGTALDELVIVLSGKATLGYVRDGQPRPTAIFRGPGDILHHAGLHLETPNPFQIVAVSDETRLVFLDRATIYELIAQDVAFAEFLFRELSVRLVVALDYLREQREEPLLLRLAKRLLLIAEDDGLVQLTQAEIAEIMAVTRISISKCFRTLEDLELISREDRSLVEVNRHALETWVAEQVAALPN